MESMLTFLRSCLKSVDLDIVTRADMRKMYMEEKGLSQLSSADKKLFSDAVTTALEEFRSTENKVSVVNPDSKKDGTNTAVEDSCGEANENQAEMKSAESDSDDDFSPENEKNNSFADKKKSGRKIFSDSEMSAEEEENINLEPVIDKGIIAKINENQNDHVLHDEQDSNESSVCIVRSEDGKNHKDAICDLSNKKVGNKILDDESSQEVPANRKDLANGQKKRLLISSSSENDSNSSLEDDSSAKTTSPKRKRIKRSNSNSAKPLQEKKSNSAQKKSDSSKRQVVSSSDSEEEVITNSLQMGKKSIPSPNSTKRSTKKNISESDDESMESPTKQASLDVSSDSENESLALLSKVKSRKSLDIVNGSAEMDSLSDDEPLVNIPKQNLNKTEGKQTRKKIVESEEDSSNKADSSDSEEEPIVKLAKKSNKKVKITKYNSIEKSPKEDSSESEDEPLSNFSKQKSKMTVTDKISSNESEEDILKSKPQKIDSDSDSEDEPIIKLVKKNSKKARVSKDKSVRKSLNAVSGSSNEDSCESEDEPLEKFSKRKLSQTECKPAASKMNSIVSEEDTTKSKPQKIDSTSDSEDEPIMKLVQKKTKNMKTVNNKSVKKSTKSKKLDCPDSGEEPLGKMSTSVDKSSPSKDSSSSSIDENEEQSLKKDIQSKKEKVSNLTKEKKRPSASENKIEHLKKYVRAAGIRVQNYTKLFKDCKSMKAKSEKLMDLLEKHGLKGNPTLEKCKKLKKKIETEKEIADLDVSNILKTEGRRSKRSVCADTTNYNESVEKASTPVKRFSRLQDIVDSEGSD